MRNITCKKGHRSLWSQGAWHNDRSNPCMCQLSLAEQWKHRVRPKLSKRPTLATSLVSIQSPGYLVLAVAPWKLVWLDEREVKDGLRNYAIPSSDWDNPPPFQDQTAPIPSRSGEILPTPCWKWSMLDRKGCCSPEWNGHGWRKGSKRERERDEHLQRPRPPNWSGSLIMGCWGESDVD